MNVNDNGSEQFIKCHICGAEMKFAAASPSMVQGPDAKTPLEIVEHVASQVGWQNTADGWSCRAHQPTLVAMN